MSFDPLALPLDGLQLIEASAGTGKTWTIAALYLRLVLQGGADGKGLSPEQILVVTFTRAATAELRGRIRARLAELASALEQQLEGHGPAADPLCAALIAQLPPEQLSDALRRVTAAVSGFDAAAIFTIHSFCQRALGEHALLAGLELGSELVADEADMVQAAFDSAYKQALALGDASWVDWLVDQGETPDRWRAELGRYLGQPWLKIEAPLVDAGPADAEFARAWEAVQQHWRNSELDDLRAAVAGGRYNGRLLRSDWLESSIERWQRWLGGPRQTGLAGKDDEKSLRRLGAPALAEAQKQPYPLPALFSLLDTLLEARSRLMRQRREQLAAAKAQALQQVNARLSADKARRGVISFNDLLLALSAALRGPHAQELARLLGTRYHAALIDEFQDTDPLQFGVFERIFVTQHKGASDKSACIFLVGDPKQAIYSFRGADLYAYLDARQRAATRHTLTTNRRSVPPLVDGVSQLFAQAKAPFLLDQLDYPPVDALDDKASLRIDGAAQPALSWAWLDEAASSKEQGLREACTQSADAIARLLALGSSGRALLGERPVSAGDIAVLAASHHQISAVQAALRDRGIASVRIGRDSVFGTEEAQALLQVLLALLEPGDRQVRAVLASHLGGLHAAALQSLAADEAAWDALLAQYRHWQQLWQRRGLLAALEGWLLDSGVAERLADWQDGERRLANLLHLFELVEQEARQRHGMHALINWYRSALAGGSEETDTRLLRLESDAARVRLVTIHASKGLQYPIVFCPFLWDGKRDEALYDAAQLSEDDSLALAHDADGTAVLDFGSPQRPMRLAQARRERVSERLRLLYVALTRAESQLVLHWGAVSGADTSALGWLLAGGEQQDLDASQWQARLNALLEQHAGTMGWLTLPADTGSAVMAAPTPVPQVARLNRHLRWRWQMSSFSSLTAGLHDERPDHDAGAAPVLDTVPEADTESAPAPVYYRDIATFPAGAHAGVMLHSVFEEWDFAREDQDALRDHATQMLEKHGFDSAWADGIANLVNTTLHSAITPFGDRLHGLGKRKKLVELEFTFSLRPFAWPQLQGLLSRPEYGLPASFAQAARQLRSEVASGYLKGFIDLSCELGGRYWVLDYKSNKLGTSPADYTATAVEAAMANEHYYLQALIYCVALHRYLKWRRPDYDHAHHFGGASYLFLRGLDPAVPLQGVWAYTPPLSLLEALEQLLCGG